MIIVVWAYLTFILSTLAYFVGAELAEPGHAQRAIYGLGRAYVEIFKTLLWLGRRAWQELRR